jgi:hypothetical protein
MALSTSSLVTVLFTINHFTPTFSVFENDNNQICDSLIKVAAFIEFVKLFSPLASWIVVSFFLLFFLMTEVT